MVGGGLFVLTDGVPTGSDPHGDVAVDFAAPLGTFRELHGVNNGPVTTYGGPDLTAYFKEAGIPSCRLHDVPHSGSRAVDISTIFPLAHADPDDPRNYTFARTDDYIQGIVDAGAAIVFRLGSSIEHSPRKYDVHPPEDYDQWARVCINIIRHYNEGWAGGFHHGIRYWEVWNEPDHSKATWTGTPAEYYELYAVAAKAIKRHDPTLKVGGPGLSGDMAFLDGFLKACRREGAPLDFVSWHHYASNPEAFGERADAVRKALDVHGFEDAESHLNEWHFFNGDWGRLRNEPGYAKSLFEEINGVPGAAFAAVAMLMLQDKPVDVANYYTGDTSRWGLFTTAGQPEKTYYAFKAFNELLKAPHRVRCEADPALQGLVIAAGVSDDRTSARLLISNRADEPKRLRIRLRNLPWTTGTTLEHFSLDDAHDLARVVADPLPADTDTFEVLCPGPGVQLIVLQRAEGR